MSHSYTLSTLANVLGLSIADNRAIDTLLTDSRTLIPNPSRALFFALKTNKGNGHLYLSDLYKKGVRAFVVSEMVDDVNFPEALFVTVEDTLQALQKIAHFHREHLSAQIVGITGSAGKTTVKELLYQILSKGSDFKIDRSPQSYNSALGVPLSLWQLSPEADLSLVEAGISEPGEMELLERLILPKIGLFTGIGDAHSEHFSSPVEKAREKFKLFCHTRVLYIGADNRSVQEALNEAKMEELQNVEVRTWSQVDPLANLFVQKMEEKPSGTVIEYLIKGETQVRRYTVPFHEKGIVEDFILALLFVHNEIPSFFRKETDALQTIFQDLRVPYMQMDVREGMDETVLVLPWGSNTPLEKESLKNALSFMRKRRLSHYLQCPKPTAVILIDEVLTEDQEIHQWKVQRYRDIADLISAGATTDDDPEGHKIIAIGKGIKPYKQILSSGGVVYYYETVDSFISHNSNSSSINQLAYTPLLYGHLILILPPFSVEKGHNTSLHHLIIESFQKKSHQTILKVNLSALRDNLNALRNLLPNREKTKVCAMIKAFGYGVGSYEVAKEFEQEGVEYMAVAVADEGKELREKGIRTKIIIMNPEPSAFVQMVHYHLEPNIYSFEMLRQFGIKVSEMGLRDYPIHLSFDTGMHRLGFSHEEIPDLLSTLIEQEIHPHTLKIASIFTHLSKADLPSEDEFTKAQLQLMTQIRDTLRSHLTYPFLTHALNTAGLMRFPEYAFDMVRMGIGLYGLSPLSIVDRKEAAIPLRPVASLETVILQTRYLKAGETVGYGNSGQLKRDSRIGVIPIGYADGLPRALGRGRAKFQVGSHHNVATIGNICMDATMIDLTDAPLAVEGSKVLLFSDGTGNEIERLAEAENDQGGTIHYEVLSRLSRRITRHYYHE